MRLKNWKDLGFLKLHSVIQNSDKFMFVRDPYSRVLSGYVDKLFSTVFLQTWIQPSEFGSTISYGFGQYYLSMHLLDEEHVGNTHRLTTLHF
jgi:asparagine synthetase A